MHLFGKYHAIRWRIFPWRRKIINFKLDVCHIWTWNKTRRSWIKLISVCPQFYDRTTTQKRKTLKQYNTHFFLLSCSAITGSHSFSRCWVLLFISYYTNMLVLNIWVFKDRENYLPHTENLKVLRLMSSQEFVYLKFC